MDARTVRAIRFSILTGKYLQDQYGIEIRERLRKGESYNDIALDLKERTHLKMSKSSFINSVRLAAVGNKNRVFGPVYAGMISKKEAKMRAKMHHSDELDRRLQYKEGIHSFTEEERSKLASKAGTASAISLGRIPWSNEEIIFAFYLMQSPEYKTNKSLSSLSIMQKRNKSELLQILERNVFDWIKISSEINRYFHSNHEVRRAYQVRNMIGYCRKKRRKLVYDGLDYLM